MDLLKTVERRENLFREHVKLHEHRLSQLLEDHKKILTKPIELSTYSAEVPIPYKLDGFQHVFNEPPEETILHPVRLDAESDTVKLRDSVLINLQDKDIEKIASITCQDLNMPDLFPQIQKCIQDQLVEGVLQPNTLLPDARIQIQLDITIGSTSLVDQFEWDISNPDQYIEHFAAALVQDLHLSPEFTVAVSHAIREQIDMYSRTFAEQETLVQWLPVVTNVTKRDPVGPIVSYLHPDQVEKLERDTDRQIRRKRRQTARSRRNNLDNDIKTIWSHYDETSLVPCHPKYGSPLHHGIANMLNNKADLKTLKAIERANAAAAAARAAAANPVPVTSHTTPASQRQNLKDPSQLKTEDNTNNANQTGSINSLAQANSNHSSQHHLPHSGSVSSGIAKAHGGSSSLENLNSSQSHLPLQQQLSLQQGQSPFSHIIHEIPEVFLRAKNELKQKYPHAIFEFTIKRSSNEIKVKCMDCPGKLYSVGPGETLDNFEVHLNNRVHLGNISSRLSMEFDN